jgi:hypothetical protein
MEIAAQKYGIADSSVACSVLTAEFPPLLVLPVRAVPASMFLMMMAIQLFKENTQSTADTTQQQTETAATSTQHAS